MKSNWIIKSTRIKENYSNHANRKEYPNLEVIAKIIYKEETKIINKTYFYVNYEILINWDIKLNLSQPLEGKKIYILTVRNNQHNTDE